MFVTDETGRVIDLGCFTTEGSLRAALGRPTGDLILTDAGGRQYAVEAIYGRPARVTARVALVDGSTVDVPAVSAGRFAGLDSMGYRVYRDDSGGFLFALTPCCQATSKGSAGSASGVCCRGCYRDVAAYFGGPAQVAVARVNPGYAARPARPGEAGEFGWVVANTATGEIVAEATQETAEVLTEALNTRRPTPAPTSAVRAPQ